MPELYVVTGAGPVGWTVAEQLAGQGKRVRILTRSGSGPEHPLIDRMSVDVSSPALLGGAFDGAEPWMPVSYTHLTLPTILLV